VPTRKTLSASYQAIATPIVRLESVRQQNPETLGAGTTKIVTRTYRYRAFLNETDKWVAIEGMAQLREILEAAALTHSLEAACNLVKRRAPSFWWPNRTFLDESLISMAKRYDRFAGAARRTPPKPLRHVNNGVLFGSVSGSVRNLAVPRDPFTAMKHSRVMPLRDLGEAWHGHPLYEVRFPIRKNHGRSGGAVQVRFAFMHDFPPGAQLNRVLLIGKNLWCQDEPLPQSYLDKVARLNADRRRTRPVEPLRPPAPRFEIGFTVSFPVTRSADLPQAHGLLEERVVFRPDGSIQIAKFTNYTTGASTTYTLPARFRERALAIPDLPSWFRERTSFYEWRKGLFRAMAADIWSNAATITVSRLDKTLMRARPISAEVLGIDEFFRKVEDVGETMGGVIVVGVTTNSENPDMSSCRVA
jgi:hypothetical protein